MKQVCDNLTREIVYTSTPKTSAQRQASLRERNKNIWRSINAKSARLVPLESLVLAAACAVRHKSLNQLATICDELTRRCDDENSDELFE